MVSVINGRAQLYSGSQKLELVRHFTPECIQILTVEALLNLLLKCDFRFLIAGPGEKWHTRKDEVNSVEKPECWVLLNKNENSQS